MFAATAACGPDDSDDAASGTETQSPNTQTGDPQTTSGDPQTTSGDPQTTSGDPQTTSGDPQTTSGDPQTTSGDPQDTTDGFFGDCTNATTPEMCAQYSGQHHTCEWYPTTLLTDVAACTNGGAGDGVCLLRDQDDGCTGIESGCDNTNANVILRPARGGYELVLDGPFCSDGIDDFTVCDYEILQERTELGDACRCACDLAG